MQIFNPMCLMVSDLWPQIFCPSSFTNLTNFLLHQYFRMKYWLKAIDWSFRRYINYGILMFQQKLWFLIFQKTTALYCLNFFVHTKMFVGRQIIMLTIGTCYTYVHGSMHWTPFTLLHTWLLLYNGFPQTGHMWIPQ